MKHVFDTASYRLSESFVNFSSQDEKRQELFDRCETACKQNISVFSGKRVLMEGAKYIGVWLETQPMGGEMYAKRDMEVALNNQLIFMELQRRDGKFPGMITCKQPWDGIAPHYDWMQGSFFPSAALNVWYYIQKDPMYLDTLAKSLEDFDAYLWDRRVSPITGCLETWCIWDTGEDNSTRYLLHGADYPRCGASQGNTPPTDYGDLPFSSAEYMAYSYANRRTLYEISLLRNDGRAAFWKEKAEEVRRLAIEKLWNADDASFYDRDKYGTEIKALAQANIKCMYHGMLTQEMAEEFMHRHLFNPEEFWTPYPLPGIALNNPYFYVDENLNHCPEATALLTGDADDNCWSGPIQGLTYQRAIQALLNYGHHTELSVLGEKWISLLEHSERLTQQYHPFTGKFSAKGADGYGPTVLSALEYISLNSGVNIARDRILWSSTENAADFTYTQHMFGKDHTLQKQGGRLTATINGKLIFTCDAGVRVETDMEGVCTAIYALSDRDFSFGAHSTKITCNSVYLPDEAGLRCLTSLPCYVRAENR